MSNWTGVINIYYQIDLKYGFLVYGIILKKYLYFKRIESNTMYIEILY
jgi:hypothetical protein